MNFVLDASVALSWCFEDEGGSYAADVLEALDQGEAVVPGLWLLEIANGLLVAERKGRIGAPDAHEARRLLSALPIAVDPVARRRSFDVTPLLARSHGLSAYDAAYLEVALRYGVPLATLDGPLRAAAEEEGIELLT